MKKTDPGYVAALEKAIADKYGTETIQNPRASWNDQKEKDYLEQLKTVAELSEQAKTEKVEVNGVLIPKQLLIKEQTGNQSP